MLENFFVLLDDRYPDKLGAVKKAEHQRSILAMLDALKVNDELPDGWVLMYGYKSLVLAACLFGADRHEEGWTAFETGISMFEKWFGFTEKDALDLGSELFDGLRIRKNWLTAVTPADEEERLYEHTPLINYTPLKLYEFLTDSRWAWFDSARRDERFTRAVDWAKSLADADENK